MLLSVRFKRKSMLFTLMMKDGKELTCQFFPSLQEETQVLQLVHGASEHSGRYEDFAAWLNERGISLYVQNLRGHGLSQGEGVDHVILNKGDEEMFVSDTLALGDYIRENHKAPLTLFGHSMGGMITRLVMTHRHPYKGFILSGTRKVSKLEIKSMKVALKIAKRKHDWEGPSDFLDKRVFLKVQKNMLKKGILENEEDDWLTKDPVEMKKNKEDHYLQQRWSISAYRGLFYLLEESSRRETYEVKHNTNILLLTGRHDGSTEYGKLTREIQEGYQEESKASVSIVYYEDARHDLLHETCKEKVFTDIEHFIKRL